jgi:lambda family phage portal protein
MNFIERVISVFSPRWAAVRQAGRASLDLLTRGYDAGSYGRRFKNWNVGPIRSADSQNSENSHLIRERSSDLVRNHPFARRAVNVLTRHIVGTGIQARITHKSPRTRDNLRIMWKNWTGGTACDFDENKTFAKIQELAVRAMLERGECFIIARTNPDSNAPMRLQLQVLEADHRARDYGFVTQDGGEVRYGIQYDSTGRKTGYWLYETHPGENTSRAKLVPTFFPSKDVIHLFDQERPGQTIGTPVGTSSVVRLRDLLDYEDAQLVAQKVKACFAVFVTKQTDINLPSSEDYEDERVTPGMIRRMSPGEQVQIATPPTISGYEEYSRSVQRSIAAGFGVTYESMTGDFSQVNFSSARMGQLEFYKGVEQSQHLLVIPILCAKIWSWFLRYALVSGYLNEQQAATATVEWTAPSRQFIDPLKEIEALNERVRGGFISWQEAVREMGYDPEQLFDQLQEDAKMFDKAGLMPASDPRFDANRGMGLEPPPKKSETKNLESE